MEFRRWIKFEFHSFFKYIVISLLTCGLLLQVLYSSSPTRSFSNPEYFAQNIEDSWLERTAEKEKELSGKSEHKLLKHKYENEEELQSKKNESMEAIRALFEQDLTMRDENRRNVCEENSEILRWREGQLLHHMQNHDLWDAVKKIVYCSMAKVASSSWSLNFLQMSGIRKEMVRRMELMPKLGIDTGVKNWAGKTGGLGIQELARYLYPSPDTNNVTWLRKYFDENVGFLVVRHPFVRLVSAYEDKMLNPHPFPYKHHHKIQMQIKRERIDKDKKIVFPEELLNSNKYQRNIRLGRIKMADLESQPSFQEFVDWLISNREAKPDTHESWRHDLTWNPFYTICPVCDLDYTILKLDSDLDELNLFIERQHLPLQQSTAEHAVGGKRKSFEKADEYFKLLTKSQIAALVNIYKYDFQLFGYDYKHYFDL